MTRLSLSLTQIETMARRQVEAYDTMVDIGQGVGGLGIKHPSMFEDMIAWDDATENNHADTVLALVGAIREVLHALDRADARPGPEGERKINTAAVRAAIDASIDATPPVVAP